MAAEEVALSIEETNKLRASLGLKPLRLEPTPPAPSRHAKREETGAGNQEGADAEALRSRLEQAREKRRHDKLLKTRTLGEADPEVDDVAAWVARSRTLQHVAEPEARDEARGRRTRGSDDDGDDGPSARELAGAKVRHDIGSLGEGEVVILTLADRGILDERGDLDSGGDELEEVVAAQEAKRKKARRAATKEAKPLWAEDGKVRRLLDKYDEEEEDAAVEFDAAGQIAAVAARQDEARRKLAEGAAVLLGGQPGAGVVAAPGGDYMTAVEAAAALDSGKKKKKRKLRSKPAVPAEDVEGGGALDLDALEAAAMQAGAGADLGSRAAREARRDAAAAALAADQSARTERFQRALEKANWASEALRPSEAATATASEAVGDDGDDELYESLNRARRLALKMGSGTDAGDATTASGHGSLQGIAAELAKRREADEAQQREQFVSGAELFTETGEFVRNIAAPGEQHDDRGDGSYMDVDEELAPPPIPAASPGATAGGVGLLPSAESASASLPAKRKAYRSGGWVTADTLEEEVQEAQQQASGAGGQQLEEAQPAVDDAQLVTRERVVGRGLGAALALLHDKGELRADKLDWAGRTNDKKKNALRGLEDVYTGGRSEDRLTQSVEAALTQRDEFGRVMTPKDRFRKLNYEFHGINPSKNKLAKRQQQYLEELALKKAASSADPSVQLDKLRAVQAQLGTPYLPLDKQSAASLPGARDDDDLAPLPHHTKRKGGGGTSVDLSKTALTPVLGGGITPLTDPHRKVEAMLGIKRTTPGNMAPPAQRHAK